MAVVIKSVCVLMCVYFFIYDRVGLKIQTGSLSRFFTNVAASATKGPFFIQCDECLKWRVIPKPAHYYPDDV